MSNHEEFPELTPEARAAFDRGYETNGLFVSHPGKADRVRFAAFLREAVKQAHAQGWEIGAAFRSNGFLMAIADNLHSPPPPAPTLAQAREAARQLGGANAEVVHAFLATLGEGEP